MMDYLTLERGVPYIDNDLGFWSSLKTLIFRDIIHYSQVANKRGAQWVKLGVDGDICQNKV